MIEWDDLKEYYNKLSRKEIFMYIVMYCIIYIYFNRNITPTMIIYTIIMAIIVIYKRELNKNIEEKKGIIKPRTEYIEKDPDLVDYVFSIQEFYEYNPQAYIELLQSIEKFMSIYEYIQYDKTTAGVEYNSLKSQKYIATEALRSIIIKCPDNRKVIEKINKSIERLNEILNRYIYEVRELNKKNIEEEGFNNRTVIISKLNEPYNETFSSKVFSKINI